MKIGETSLRGGVCVRCLARLFGWQALVVRRDGAIKTRQSRQVSEGFPVKLAPVGLKFG